MMGRCLPIILKGIASALLLLLFVALLLLNERLARCPIGMFGEVPCAWQLATLTTKVIIVCQMMSCQIMISPRGSNSV